MININNVSRNKILQNMFKSKTDNMEKIQHYTKCGYGNRGGLGTQVRWVVLGLGSFNAVVSSSHSVNNELARTWEEVVAV
jgi:hypothetical protein